MGDETDRSALKEEAERRLRRAIEEAEAFERDFFDKNPYIGALIGEHFDRYQLGRRPLSDAEKEAAVALNLLYEELDWRQFELINARIAEAEAAGRSGDEQTREDDLAEGERFGLSRAQYEVCDELRRRDLPFVAQGAPWPY